MAKKKTSANKSQAIRDHLAKHPDDMPRAIVAALKKRNITATTTLVSVVKSRRRRRKKAATTQPTVSDKISISALVQAKKMADQLGGIEEAQAALSALAKLQ